MCTILTIDRNFWILNRHETIATILSDATYNSEGWSLLAVDAKNSKLDMRLATMQIGPIIAAIESWFLSSSEVARIFLHARAATTSSVGIAYNHVFCNKRGTIIMHNGVIDNVADYAVDSFNLANSVLEADGGQVLADLLSKQETFANLFLINPDEGLYSVVRLTTGRLYTDGSGNYSTNTLTAIKTLVPVNSYNDHYLDCYVSEYTSWIDETEQEYVSDSYDYFSKWRKV